MGIADHGIEERIRFAFVLDKKPPLVIKSVSTNRYFMERMLHNQYSVDDLMPFVDSQNIAWLAHRRPNFRRHIHDHIPRRKWC